MNKDNSSKNLDYSIIDNTKEDDYEYIIDSKNILKIESTKKLNEEFGKYFGIQIDTSEEDIINQSTNSSMTNSVGNTNIDNNIQKLMFIFTEKLFPKCNLDGFQISKKLGTKYIKKINENKNKLEECINYFFYNKQILKYSGFINLDSKIINNLGYILLVTYNKFNDFKIYDRKALKTNLKKTIKDSQDALQDFYNYCIKKNYIPEHHKKVSYWENHSENYYLPGIFIFLINSLDKIETININFDLINESITDEYIDYFSICIYNLQYIFNNVNHVRINLINNKLQCNIFSTFYEEFQKALNEINVDIKKRYLKLDYIYNKKWDFKTEFLLEEFRQIYKNEQKKKDGNKINNKNKAKTNVIYSGEIKNETKINAKGSGILRFSEIFRDIKSNFHQRFSVQPGELIPKLSKSNTFIENEIEFDEMYENEQLSKNNPDMIYKKKEANSNILKLILLSINAINRLNNLCKLDLILNDSYYSEFYNFFENEIFDQENKSTNISLLKDFHLLDIISNKFMKLNSLNLEMNSLDSITFKKIIEYIYSNPLQLISLYISFFSSDVTYSLQSLYKLCNPMQEISLKSYRDIYQLKILDKLLTNFASNMQILFDLIKYKKIQILGFNLDIPDIIESNQKYIMVITKFILNLLLYITKKETVIQKVIILASKIKINNDFSIFFDKILGKINYNENNKVIKELSIQLQLYKIINIKNIISESLIILNIGDCDNHTFKELVKFLTSFKFSFRSSLSELTISLIKSIRILNKEIYSILYKIFNIKIKRLKQVNIYSNIIINHSKEYIYLLNIFNNNWISSCTLTLNSKSENIYNASSCLIEKNKIKYLVPASLENELLSPQDMILRKKINNDKTDNKNDDAFWYLKYIFKIRYSCIDNNKKNRIESLSKFLANNILSYIHFQKSIIINHNIDLKE
jgi:hypothetical protein